MERNVSELLGKTLKSVDKIGVTALKFTLEDGKEYVLTHEQECCESVTIEDIVGELNDLIGSPLTMSEESVSRTNPDDVKIDPDHQDSFTWTFYRFATVKGYVTVRWYGESNGYYSEKVDFIELT